MREYILSACSTVDLTEEYFEQRSIPFICYHYELDGKQYRDDFGKTIPLEQFYEAMANGADTRTSQINAEEYSAYFEPFLQAGKDIIHLAMSSGISGSVNSAYIAKSMMEEKYPDRKIYIVDSLAASSGYGLLLDRMADLRDEGMTIDDLHQWVEENKLKMNHWVLVSDLTFLVKGGRVSKTAGFVGSMLNICPMINVDYEGRLIPRAKIRTKRKGIQALADKMEELAEDGLEYSGKCYISHSACYEDARAVADLVEAKFPKLNGKVEIYSIGTTIGSHTGPGTVALFFWGNERVE